MVYGILSRRLGTMPCTLHPLSSDGSFSPKDCLVSFVISGGAESPRPEAKSRMHELKLPAQPGTQPQP